MSTGPTPSRSGRVLFSGAALLGSGGLAIACWVMLASWAGHPPSLYVVWQWVAVVALGVMALGIMLLAWGAALHLRSRSGLPSFALVDADHAVPPPGTEPARLPRAVWWLTAPMVIGFVWLNHLMLMLPYHPVHVLCLVGIGAGMLGLAGRLLLNLNSHIYIGSIVSGVGTAFMVWICMHWILQRMDQGDLWGAAEALLVTFVPASVLFMSGLILSAAIVAAWTHWRERRAHGCNDAGPAGGS